MPEITTTKIDTYVFSTGNGLEGKVFLFPFIFMRNHVGARPCRKPLGRRKGLNISTTLGLTKSRAFDHICCQNISITGGFTKTRAFDHKSCQNISSTVWFTKTRAFDHKSCQMPCPFTGPKTFWAGPNFLCHTKNWFMYICILPVPNFLCQTKRWFSCMSCPFTGPKMFCAGPNFLSQSKNLIAFSASLETFVPAQKTILLNANHQLFWHNM